MNATTFSVWIVLALSCFGSSRMQAQEHQSANIGSYFEDAAEEQLDVNLIEKVDLFEHDAHAPNDDRICLSDFDLLDVLAFEVKEIREESRSIRRVEARVLNLTRSVPVPPAGITAMEMGSAKAYQLGIEFGKWEARALFADEFLGRSGGFSYRSQLTAIELNREIFERPMYCGCLKGLIGLRYLGLHDVVSCPPFEQTVSNDMIGLHGSLRWRRKVLENLDFYSRFSPGLMTSFVDKRHGDFFADQQILATLQLEINLGLQAHLGSGIYADVAYQAYGITNVPTAYTATPSFNEIHEGNVFIQGVAFGISVKY